ncbi:LigA protein [Kutzneria sp. 744]|nr:LigA protein [Kutzneria sp. 744]
MVSVGVTLPSEVTWVLDLIGVEWPNIDEDELRSAADQLRELGSELSSNNGDAKSEIEEMLGVNSAESLEIFEALWKKLAEGHLQQLGEGMDLLATGLDIAAVVIMAMKLAAIVQLVILAAEIIADQAAAIETLGASEALAVAQTEITEQIVKQAIEQAIQTVEQQLLSVVEGPIFAALESAGTELATQLVGDALGTHQGLDMGAVANAGVDGFSQGVSDSVDQVEGMADSVVNDPLGTAESVATNQGIPT